MIDNKDTYLKMQRNKLSIIWLIILIVNVALTVFHFLVLEPHATSENLAGDKVSGFTLMKSVLLALVIGIPLLSSLIALLVNFIPNGGLEYKQKFILSVLMTIIVIQALYFILEIKSLMRM